ncbi:MAG: ABC transporter ATP-binding protein [Methanospirillum sp.]
MIELVGLTKEYDGVRAVDDLTLRISAGEVFGLLGPNGAGKSTTILMLLGLIEPTAGRVLVDGVEVTADPCGVRRRIGYMPEDIGFYANLTAEQNLEYFGRLYGLDDGVRRQRIRDLLERVGLAKARQPVGGFSKGMRQRLGLAKALLPDPALVVLDEPTANLDPVGAADCRAVIAEAAEEGKTVIISSHILSEVQRVCTTVGILSRGRLVAHGGWDEVARAARADRTAVTIRIRAADPLPAVDHPAIEEVGWSKDRRTATIRAREDIRPELGEILSSYGLYELQLASGQIDDLLLAYYGAEA